MKTKCFAGPFTYMWIIEFHHIRIYVPALFRAQSAGGGGEPSHALKEKPNIVDFLSEVITYIRFETASNTNWWSQYHLGIPSGELCMLTVLTMNH